MILQKVSIFMSQTWFNWSAFVSKKLFWLSAVFVNIFIGCQVDYIVSLAV